MPRRLIVAVLAAVSASALPATAGAQCGPPKGIYVANAELANAVYLFTGRTGDALSGGDPRAVATLAGASADLAAAAAGYPGKVLVALREPPECASARRAHARRTPRASAGRRR